MAFQGDWNSSATYAEGDVVRHDDSMWVALADLPANKEPGVVISGPDISYYHENFSDNQNVTAKWLGYGAQDWSVPHPNPYPSTKAYFYFDVITPGTLTLDKDPQTLESNLFVVDKFAATTVGASSGANDLSLTLAVARFIAIVGSTVNTIA